MLHQENDILTDKLYINKYGINTEIINLLSNFSGMASSNVATGDVSLRIKNAMESIAVETEVMSDLAAT